MISDYIGNTVRFSTLAPAVLGALRENVTVLAILDLDTAQMLSDVRAKHVQVRNYIATLPQSAGSYNYVKLRYGNGDIEILGVPWIDASTIEVITDRKLVITIGNVSDSTEQLVRQALLQNGIENFEVEAVGTTSSGV